MDRHEILEATRGVMARTFEVDPASVTEATTADDIERWDSLTHLILVLGLEKRFNTMLPMERVRAAQDVGGVVDLVAEALGAA